METGTCPPSKVLLHMLQGSLVCCAVHRLRYLHHASVLHVGEAHRHPLQAQLDQAALQAACG